MTTYNVCIIGGGAAGIMAAFSARHHHKDASIVVIDHTFELGRKLVISGSGRGNLTNKNVQQSGLFHFHGDRHLIDHVFSKYDFSHIVSFFESHGIALYEEQKTGKGKLFPVIDNAKTVRDVLIDDLEHDDVEIQTSTDVVTMTYDDGIWTIQTNKGIVKAKNVILACGGTTYPSLGSNGSGYTLAQSIGHTIVHPVPSAVPLVSKNMLSHLLQGERIVAELHTDKTTVVGDVLFTQYGISGSAVLDISREISVSLNRKKQNEIHLSLSFFPSKEKQEVEMLIEKRLTQFADRLVSRALWGLFSTKVANAVCAVSNIPKGTLVRELTEKQKETLVETLTDYKIPVTETRGWNEAEFTAGGVNTEEIDNVALASKKAHHVYFAGEILDVDGDVGGYNLSWAWASGWVAGQLLSS